MAQDLNLFVDAENGRLVLGFASTIPATLPSFKFGDTVPVSVRVLTAAGNDSLQPFKEYDLTDRSIRLALGVPAGRPSSGTFTLTFGANTTAAIPFNATAEQVATALNAIASITSAGGVTVTAAGAGAYRVIFNTAGARAAITADTAPLYPSTGAFIDEAQAGDGSTREVVLVRLEVQPAAYVQLDDELPAAAVAVTVTRAGSVGVGTIQTLDLSNPEPYGGDYALTVDGHATGAITFNALASEVQSAIQAAHASFSGKVTVTGAFPRYTVSFDASLESVDEMVPNVAALIAPKGRKGLLSLNTTGIVELLNGASSAAAKLEIEIRNTLDSTSWTPIQQDVTVVEDVIPSNPASQTPLPEFATSDDIAAGIAGSAVRYDAEQSLSSVEQEQARENIDAPPVHFEQAAEAGANYDLTYTDAGKCILKSHASAHTITVYSHASWVVSDVVTIINVGPGALSFGNDGGTLINGALVLTENQAAQILYQGGGVFRIL